MNLFRTLLLRVFGLVKHHVGTDQFGNKYYYVPEQKTWMGQAVRSRRIIEVVSPKEIEYEHGNIPLEWEDGPGQQICKNITTYKWSQYHMLLLLGLNTQNTVAIPSIKCLDTRKQKRPTYHRGNSEE
ncbi:NADH dehydrogenase [ubiquinone] 1 alpha subcomplex assembly factor 2 isoform X3 [Pristis pectinata]|uniref:NADH dehydrogenase [ubiquinone] 1 alpha subcomplex assembly factor 2 isoform X3 n=1 Tax=Pristis pectinata TaxID=685728 RepID=UPI00223E0D2D|nr:NADH dehydrogenase [ubiquinone] 1 alpha subcomplex assembly factor 2 isoform X3 [Pristis pectinata]